jgi:hypothetical protein
LCPEQTSTLDTVNNLENNYKNEGKLVEAEQMYRYLILYTDNALCALDVVATFLPRRSSPLGIKIYVYQEKLLS